MSFLNKSYIALTLLTSSKRNKFLLLLFLIILSLIITLVKQISTLEENEINHAKTNLNTLLANQSLQLQYQIKEQQNKIKQFIQIPSFLNEVNNRNISTDVNSNFKKNEQFHVSIDREFNYAIYNTDRKIIGFSENFLIGNLTVNLENLLNDTLLNQILVIPNQINDVQSINFPLEQFNPLLFFPINYNSQIIGALVAQSKQAILKTQPLLNNQINNTTFYFKNLENKQTRSSSVDTNFDEFKTISLGETSILTAEKYIKNLNIVIAAQIPKKELLATYIEQRNVIFVLIGLLAALILYIAYYIFFNKQYSRDLEQQINSSVYLKTLNYLLAKKEAEKCNQEKTKFLVNLNHELRTPLNAILGFANLLNIQKDASKYQQHHLQEIINAGNLLRDLIDNCLDIITIESGNFHLNKSNINLVDSIKQCISLLEETANQKNITIDFIHNTEGLCINADQTRIKQILLNLISNAIKYSEENNKIVINVEEKGNHALITLADKGFGINAEDLPFLFQPFKRFHLKSHQVEGSGVGLSLVKKFIDAHNGTITVNSELNKGTTFSISLPIGNQIENKEESTSVLYRDDKTDNSLIELAEKSILLIEDNKANLKFLQHVFKLENNINLHCAGNATDGLEILKHQSIDLVLMDIQLPDMNGFEALNKIKSDKQTQDIPVIAVSANAMIKDVELGNVAGFEKYICKPINIKSFLVDVRNTLNKSKSKLINSKISH